MKLGVKVKRLNAELPLPQHATAGSAGVDLYANITEAIVINEGDTVVIPTGIAVEIPPSYEMQIRPRSGLAVKNNITVLNSPGTIDSDFRGEVGVVLYYAPTKKGLISLIKELVFKGFKGTNTAVIINPADRIAQAVFTKYEQVNWYPVAELTETVRGEGSYGHTGVKVNG
jgi:dUTP pyrophosphatase